MFEYTLNIRVRYAETDQMGYVYYGNYAKYYEIARTEMLRSIGLSYKEMEEEGIMMPVLKVESLYKAPVHYDELLEIKISIRELPQSRITFFVDLYNEDKKLVHQGITTLVFVRSDSRRPCRCPENLYKKIAVFF